MQMPKFLSLDFLFQSFWNFIMIFDSLFQGRTQKISKGGDSIPHSGADPENFGGEGMNF